ncbi:helix-turn-helix domain-containing protein [Enterobacter cloacae]|nr:helix-turn-helix transcriptional regulator [Enterobacter cloacae]
MFTRTFVILHDRIIVSHNYFLAAGIHNSMLHSDRISYLTRDENIIQGTKKFIYLSCVEFMYDLLAGFLPASSRVYIYDDTARFCLTRTLVVLRNAVAAPVVSVFHQKKDPVEMIKKIGYLKPDKEYPDTDFKPLTEMEHQVFELLLNGHDIPDIAEMMMRTPKYVYAIKSRIMLKLGINNFDFFYLLIRPVRTRFLKHLSLWKHNASG